MKAANNLTLAAVCQRVGIPKHDLHDMWHEGSFSTPYRPDDARSICWDSDEVSAWLAQRQQQATLRAGGET